MNSDENSDPDSFRIAFDWSSMFLDAMVWTKFGTYWILLQGFIHPVILSSLSRPSNAAWEKLWYLKKGGFIM